MPLHEISAFGPLASFRCRRLIAELIVLSPGAPLRPQLVPQQHPQTDEESHADNH
jgi:hypothetical protein